MQRLLPAARLQARRERLEGPRHGRLLEHQRLRRLVGQGRLRNHASGVGGPGGEGKRAPFRASANVRHQEMEMGAWVRWGRGEDKAVG